jgi:uncharacterized phage protein (TIGR02216 family)
MQLGLGRLGWSPDVFWSSTLKELYAAAQGLNKANRPHTDKPMSTRRLKQLMERYPDAHRQS